MIAMMIAKPFLAVAAYLVFAFVLGCAIADELRGRRNCGEDYEPGDGIGRPEDYES